MCDVWVASHAHRSKYVILENGKNSFEQVIQNNIANTLPLFWGDGKILLAVLLDSTLQK